MSDESDAKWFEVEKRALLGRRSEITMIVSALRHYRGAVKALLAKRYSDGEVDAVALSRFAYALLYVDDLVAEEDAPVSHVPASLERLISK